MAEIAENENQEHELMIEEEKDEEKNESDSEISTSTSFLSELNLILILSCLSPSAEECLNSEEVKREMDYVKDHKKAKSVALSLQKRKRELNEFRAVERQAVRFQPRMRDCRHCRKM